MKAELLMVLPSIHDVLAVEDRARDAGHWVDILPKPTSIATDCGMVVGCLEADRDAFLAHVQEAGAEVIGVYRVDVDGFTGL